MTTSIPFIGISATSDHTENRTVLFDRVPETPQEAYAAGEKICSTLGYGAVLMGIAGNLIVAGPDHDKCRVLLRSVDIYAREQRR